MLSRLVVLLQLVLLCLSLNCLLPQSGRATEKKDTPAPKAEKPGGLRKLVGALGHKKAAPISGKSVEVPNQVGLRTWEITVWGENQQDAEERAVNKVVQNTVDYLRERNPQMVWSPSAKYVRDHLTWGKAERKSADDQEVQVGDEKVKAECWTWTVSLTPQQYDEMLREDARVRAGQARQERTVRSQERLLMLAKVLAVVLAGLLAAVGYIRLDEWTRGYYSRWLALAGAGLLAGVGLVVWWSLRA